MSSFPLHSSPDVLTRFTESCGFRPPHTRPFVYASRCPTHPDDPGERLAEGPTEGECLWVDFGPETWGLFGEGGPLVG